MPSCRRLPSFVFDPDKPIMFYALGWFFIFTLLALWSLAAWAANAVVVWTVSNAGALTGAAAGAAAGAQGLQLPEWLAPWVPQEIVQAMTALLSGLAPVVENLLQSAPALAAGLSVATWVIWGIGSALLVLLGVGLHVLIAMWRRNGSGSGHQPGRQLPA